MNRMIFISGGARSGKSSLGENISRELNKLYKNNKKIAYIATAAITDEEFEERIEKHKKRRGAIYETFEECIDVDKILKKIYQDHNVFIIECLTTWLGNIYHTKENIIIEDFIVDKLNNIFKLFLNKKYNPEDLDESKINNILSPGFNIKNGLFNDLMDLGKEDKTIILISNEAGSGIVPDNDLARDYRDILGRINQMTAYMADFVFHCIYGIPVRLK